MSTDFKALSFYNNLHGVSKQVFVELISGGNKDFYLYKSINSLQICCARGKGSDGEWVYLYFDKNVEIENGEMRFDISIERLLDLLLLAEDL